MPLIEAKPYRIGMLVTTGFVGYQLASDLVRGTGAEKGGNGVGSGAEAHP